MDCEGIVPLKQIEYGVYGDLSIKYPKLYAIYLRGTIECRMVGAKVLSFLALNAGVS